MLHSLNPLFFRREKGGGMCVRFLGREGWGKFTSSIATYVEIFTVGICYEAVCSTFHVVVFGNFQLITAKRTFAFFPSQ